MVRKEKCIEILERRLETFPLIDDVGELHRFYDRCCEVVWFLEDAKVFSEDDTWIWTDKLADAFSRAWLRINGRFDR